MAEIRYNLNSLYREAFPDLASKVLGRLDGVRDVALEKLDTALGNGFKVPPASQELEPKLNFQGINAVAVVQGDELSYLGTPIFQPITFLGGMYKRLGTGSKAGQVVMADYAGWRLPATATAEFARAKTIARNLPNGQTGTVKEMWALQDWEITIRGLILDGQPNVFPTGELRMLASWEKVADSIGVSGEMFGHLGISHLVIERLSIGKVAGMPNVVPFQMQCVSDKDLVLSTVEAAAREALSFSTPRPVPPLPPGVVRVVGASRLGR